MKKGFVAGVALLMSVAFVTCVFAQAATEKPTSPAQATPAPEKKAEVSKAKLKHAKGEVTAIDMAAKSMTIKGEKGEMTFDLANAKMKTEPKVGDKVLVKYTEADGKMMAKYVSTGKHHKHHKKAEKKEAAPAAEKPATAPQAAPAPAK